jgi:hypothetical protein
MLDQLRWVQNGYKIRVSPGNTDAMFESDLVGGTRHCANQVIRAEPLTVG